MAPIKFEDNIKGKLDKRTLKPSDDAWKKLSERLDNQEEKNNKKGYWWLGLAASIVGILFIVSQFLNNEIKKDDTPKIVDAPKTIIQNNENINIATENKVSDSVKKLGIKPETRKTLEKTKTQELFKPSNVKNYAVAANELETISKEKSKTSVVSELPKKTLTFEEQKIQDVVAEVQSLKNENKVVADADIDALLEAAQKEIIRNRLYNETKGVVDANALLQDVEAELDQSSFRNKVFEALKSSYNSVKTAVAQRND